MGKIWFIQFTVTGRSLNTLLPLAQTIYLLTIPRLSTILNFSIKLSSKIPFSVKLWIYKITS